MTSYSNGGGLFNPAYHDSETLEIDRRSTSKPHHANPYARDRAEPQYSLTGQTSRDHAVGRMGSQEESWRGRQSIPMGPISTLPGGPTRQHDLNHSTFQIPLDSGYDRSRSTRLPSSMSGNMTMRWRGATLRGMSMFPNADPTRLALTEDAIRNEMENEEQNLVKELVAMSTLDRVRAIRDLPMSFEEKKHIRSQVLAFKSTKRSRKFTCFADCSESVSLSFRRFGYAISSARQTLELWQGIMKEIGGKFGTSVLSYFLFLKWLLMFNIFSFLVNFGFITIPLLVYSPYPNIPANVSFKGLELLTGAGYFQHTVMYYGGYSDETLMGLVDYDMQLAYFFTIAIYMVLCGIALIFSMASSFQKNYVLADPASKGAWQLLCSWDFNITNERAVRQRKSNLRVQLKESLSEKTQTELLTRSEKLKHFGIHLGAWSLSTTLAIGCGASIYYLSQYENEQATDGDWSLLQEAETLLVPFVVSLMNLVVPLFFSLFNKFEQYSSQRKQIYALVARNVLLKMSILAVLCYYWMNVVAERFSCWESKVGQALYRLVIVDFLFLMLGSFFGEFLSKVIGTRFLPSLGVPEFDVARNVFELINAQTLAWIGIYFSPLLPVIQIVKFFILFYVKKVSLTQNCQPPRRSGRAAQMQTIFIALLFFPSFVGALSMVAYTAFSLTPSKQCGPFRGLNNTFSVVGLWIDGLEEGKVSSVQWVVWVYQKVIRSEVFYFLITLIIMVIIYIFWQVTKGRKLLIVHLRQQIVNEGKDKSFLLEKLQNLQKSQPNKKSNPKKEKRPNSRRSNDHPLVAQSNSNAMVQALLARQRQEEQEERGHTSTSSALAQAMLARQRADDNQDVESYQTPDNHSSSSSSAVTQAMQARQKAQAQERSGHYSTTGYSPENPVNTSSAVAQAMQARHRAQDADDQPSTMSVMMQVMQARQRAEEEEDRNHWVQPAPLQQPAPTGSSSALIQAMLARQQAQNEYDDGY